MVDRPQALVLTYPHLFWTNVGGIQDNVADNRDPAPGLARGSFLSFPKIEFYFASLTK